MSQDHTTGNSGTSAVLFGFGMDDDGSAFELMQLQSVADDETCRLPLRIDNQLGQIACRLLPMR